MTRLPASQLSITMELLIQPECWAVSLRRPAITNFLIGGSLAFGTSLTFPNITSPVVWMKSASIIALFQPQKFKPSIRGSGGQNGVQYNLPTFLDTDQDGIPDFWEILSAPIRSRRATTTTATATAIPTWKNTTTGWPCRTPSPSPTRPSAWISIALRPVRPPGFLRHQWHPRPGVSHQCFELHQCPGGG